MCNLKNGTKNLFFIISFLKIWLLSITLVLTLFMTFTTWYISDWIWV